MIIIRITDVIGVEPDGLIYSNGSGATEKLLFDECRRNWAAHVNQGEFRDHHGNPLHISFEDTKCIGERFMTGKSPYLLLFGDEKLKIEMRHGIFKRITDTQKRLPVLLYEVAKVTTFDMS